MPSTCPEAEAYDELVGNFEGALRQDTAEWNATERSGRDHEVRTEGGEGATYACTPRRMY